MPMNRNTFRRDLEEGLNAHFGMGYRDHAEEWRQVFDVESSSKAFEEDVREFGFGAAQVKAEGKAFAMDEGGQGWMARYVHETIALGFAITEEAVEDNLYTKLGPKYAKALARAMKHTKEIKAASILNNAFSVNHPGGDGKPLLADDHPLLGGGVYSNILETPADLAEAAIEDLLIKIRRAVDDRGVPIALMPTGMIIPPELEYEFTRILRTPGRPGTDLNDINAVARKGIFSSDARIVTRLTDTSAWFIKTDAPEGLKHYQRVKLKRGMEGDFDTGNMRYKARERYSFGWTDPLSLYGSAGVA